MNESAMLLTAGFAGFVLGVVFFGGLWWTVREVVRSPRPALWFLGSLVVRMSIVVAGFYFVGHGHWERLLTCLLGFILARLTVTRLTRPPLELRNASAKEAGHAT